ncbi:hypothetical protein D9I96_20250 [Escherichia coli]|nr:hypothetical protein [Escherichia coli]
MTAWTVTSEKRHLHRILNRLPEFTDKTLSRKPGAVQLSQQFPRQLILCLIWYRHNNCRNRLLV